MGLVGGGFGLCGRVPGVCGSRHGHVLLVLPSQVKEILL